MTFIRQETVMFRHCDPAGIAFYPRLFEMVNDTVEDFFAEIGRPFQAVHQRGALPTARIEMEFHAPVRLGEALALALAPIRIGRTSLGYRVAATSAASPRFTAAATIVNTGSDLHPEPWPDPLRRKFAEYQELAT